MASPVPPLVDASLPSYLLPAAITALAESTAAAARRRLALERAAEGDSAVSANAHATPDKGKAGEEQIPRLVEEGVAARLESIGLMVGGYIAEK
jgi:hypothetical protein